MSIESGALGLGRSWAQSRMTDTVRITRETIGEGTDDNGNPVIVSTTTIYEGVCRLVQRSSAEVRDVDAQSQLLAVQKPELHVPVAGTAGVKHADRFEILSSLGDPQLVGLKGWVAGMFPHSGSTARRLPVEVTS